MKTKNIYSFILAGCMAGTILSSCDQQQIEEGGQEPTVTTVSLRNVTYTTAECVAETTGNVSERGVCWSTEASPTVNADKVSDSADSGEFTASITGLDEGTVYYVRAYAKVGSEYIYGRQQSFRTYETGEPILNIVRIDDIMSHEARLTASLSANGGTDVTELGVCYSVSPEPLITDMKLMSDDRIPGNYFLTATGLLDATKYYVRAYAITVDGIFYSNSELEFTTLEDFPICKTPVLSDPGNDTVTAKVEVAQTGDRTILSWGICWSATSFPAPTIDNHKVELGTTYGGYGTTTVTDLPPGAKLFMRAYATTAISTTYSDITYTRTAQIAPVVETGTIIASSLFKHSAVISGNKVTGLGEEELPILEAGICYSWTDMVPTIEDNKVVQTQLGVVTMDDLKMSILPSGRKIYVRAYATNEKFTGYGEAIEFTTAPDNRVLQSDGGAAPLDPYFNALRFYYLSTDDGGTAATTADLGDWQTEQLKAMQKGFNDAGGRKFDYMVFLFSSNKAIAGVAPTAGTEDYMTVRIQYRSSTGGSLSAYYDLKVHTDEMGLYTFSNIRVQSGVTVYSNYTALKTWATIRPELEKFEAYLTENTFMLEFESPSSIGYHLIPVDNPTHYTKMLYARYSSVAYMPAW